MLKNESAYLQTKSLKSYAMLAMSVIRSAILDGDVKFFEDERRYSLWFDMAEFASALPVQRCRELAMEVNNSRINDEVDIFSLVEG